MLTPGGRRKTTRFTTATKIHALADASSKFLIHNVATPANVHDSKALNWVLNEEEDEGRVLYADSAYAGKELEEIVRYFNVTPCFCERAGSTIL